MKYNMKYGLGGIDNAAVCALSVQTGNITYVNTKLVSEVSEKFLQSAVLLSAGGYLAWQISAEDPCLSSCVFSNTESRVTARDYAWIFRNCAEVSSETAASAGDLFESGRRVYVLSTAAGRIPADRPCTEDLMWPDDDCGERLNSRYVEELLEMLKESRTVIRVIAGAPDGNGSGCGTVFLSLQEEIPLRLRSMLSLVFPGTAAAELCRPAASLKETGCGTDAGEDAVCLSETCLKDCLSRLLHILIYQKIKEKEPDVPKLSVLPDPDEGPDPEAPIDVETDDATCTPIDRLGLSIRAYNCLNRAGIHTVEELRAKRTEELMQVRNLGRKSIFEIRQKLADFRDYIPLIPQKAPDHMTMLNELIGLKDAKDHIRKLTAFAKMKQDFSDRGNNCLSSALNMAFIGNPGTAKTTAARITAGILHEIGLLPCAEMIEAGRADLVARYEGQTADKVREIFARARGKVLFIDEAYALVENFRGEYGDEAINTIVQEMENHREDTVVIFAGYPDEMEKFFLRNPGLRSRVPFTVHFSDYSAEELLQITELETKKRGFALNPDARDKVMQLCRAAAADPDAGNGRFSRNLAENAVMNYALRVCGDGTSAAAEGGERILCPEDIALPAVPVKKQKHPLGFLS